MKLQTGWKSVRLAMSIAVLPLGIATAQSEGPEVSAPDRFTAPGAETGPSWEAMDLAAVGNALRISPETYFANLRVLQPDVDLIGPARGEGTLPLASARGAAWLPSSAYEMVSDPRTGEDDAIRAHLATVLEFLVNGDVSRLSPALQEQRRLQLERLSTYLERGIYPRNERLGGFAPVFIDGQGRSCAVAYLMIESGSRDLAESVARTQNNSYVPRIAVPGVAEWIAGSGLDAEECAWIQPTYGRPLLLYPVMLAPAEFSAYPREGAAPLNVRFWGNSHPPANSSWDFGDGGTSSRRNPLHSYTTPGTYTVTLTVRWGPYSQSETKVGYIHVLP